MNLYRSSISTTRTIKPNINQYVPDGSQSCETGRFPWIGRKGEGIVKPLNQSRINADDQGLKVPHIFKEACPWNPQIEEPSIEFMAYKVKERKRPMLFGKMKA